MEKNIEYDFFDLENGLRVISSKEEDIDVEVEITSKDLLSSITEEQLQKSYKFHEKINEYHAKAIESAYSYVVI